MVLSRSISRSSPLFRPHRRPVRTREHRLFRIRSICERVIGRLKQDGHQSQGWMVTCTPHRTSKQWTNHLSAFEHLVHTAVWTHTWCRTSFLLCFQMELSMHCKILNKEPIKVAWLELSLTVPKTYFHASSICSAQAICLRKLSDRDGL